MNPTILDRILFPPVTRADSAAPPRTACWSAPARPSSSPSGCWPRARASQCPGPGQIHRNLIRKLY